MADRVAFVTSGASGLGLAMVRALLEAEWDVFFTYRTSGVRARELVEYAASLGRTAVPWQVDLLDMEAVQAAADGCMRSFSRVDALVHNFGPFIFEHVRVADSTPDHWREMVHGNVTNFLTLCRCLVPEMRRRRFGRIVTVGFAGAGEAAGWRYRGEYAAAKAALASLTRTIAKEERDYGITANMVCPGDIRGIHKTSRISDVTVSVGGRRPAVGEDVGRVVAFLCHPLSGELSGTIMEVTGGAEILRTNWSDDDGQRGG
ncbi:putative oxidoreductase YtkK [Alicyclobacillus contaminans]|uniref:SDR family oxidoreductase n=1 Tax=Alicyclobacillus contaminans TaxID=392016 RepID=UPI000422BBB9|nr:SDR family oxidoreductase [Alicyclobacillus contaminans]GMA51993.1 putative oxidoreductase YtkK [Alicyclobacillus contaminans]